ncbi:MinD/ParA family protein [Alteribacter populi]|uniref:MinD/ParA family protein n=1 Tax=Alteribacter populi TaxID=2011011 RepID=UPI000BBAA1FE|nr:MinD/ParA family protein [Alteribacter populi]
MANDQATILRNQMKNYGMKKESERKATPSSSTKVMAVVSGKGGVGKSNFTINFSLSLIKQKKRVLIIDMDIGMANIDILLGKAARYSFLDMIYERKSIRSIIEHTSDGISFIAGGTGMTEIVELNEADLRFFTKELTSLSDDYEYILFDLGAGVSQASLQALLAAHEIIVLTTPEPTAMTDAYGMIKFIHSHSQDLPMQLVVNQCRTDQEGKRVADNLIRVTEKFLNKKIESFGYLPKDEAVWNAVCDQKPYLVHEPNAKVSKAMHRVAQQYLGKKIESEPSFQAFVKKFKGWLLKE